MTLSVVWCLIVANAILLCFLLTKTDRLNDKTYTVRSSESY